MSTWTVVKLLLLAAYSWGWYHYGTLQTKLNDAHAVAKQEARQGAQQAKDTIAINQEAIDHDKAIAAAPDPTPVLLCVRKYAAPKPLSAAAPAAGGVVPAPDVPKADSGGFDPGPKLTPIGRAADADVVRWQSYVRDVCLVRR